MGKIGFASSQDILRLVTHWKFGGKFFSLKVFLTTTFNFPSPVRSIIFVWLAVFGLAGPQKLERQE